MVTTSGDTLCLWDVATSIETESARIIFDANLSTIDVHDDRVVVGDRLGQWHLLEIG
ncbi:MAG: hypothetical protein HQL39_08035 [Alphaproteobacteria bacterium]|nr:hypothetical protein [Alphaproteobacteria bacterium]